MAEFDVGNRLARRKTLALSAAAAASVVLWRSPTLAADTGQVLGEAASLYAGLASYRDRGTVSVEYASPGAPVTTDRFSFMTLFRRPRQFLFDFSSDDADNRMVIWANGGDFNTWWSQTKVHDDYPQGQGDTAFAVASYPTQGVALMIAPLLFSTAGLHGSLTDFTPSGEAENETLDGHVCQKLNGRIALAYGTGTVTGARSAGVWIDAQTHLVRRVFQDSPEDYGTGFANRITTSFDPDANLQIEDQKFDFAVPDG